MYATARNRTFSSCASSLTCGRDPQSLLPRVDEVIEGRALRPRVARIVATHEYLLHGSHSIPLLFSRGQYSSLRPSA
jgi:hypothetical protein